MEGVADEDGWVTVSRHGKSKTAALTEGQQQRVTAKDRKKRKEKVSLSYQMNNQNIQLFSRNSVATAKFPNKV